MKKAAEVLGNETLLVAAKEAKNWQHVRSCVGVRQNGGRLSEIAAALKKRSLENASKEEVTVRRGLGGGRNEEQANAKQDHREERARLLKAARSSDLIGGAT